MPTIKPPTNIFNPTGTLSNPAAPCPFINVVITEVVWQDNYAWIAKANATIAGPFDWKHGQTNKATPDPDNFCYNGCSEKPALYFIQSTTNTNYKLPKVDVTIEVIGDCSASIPDSKIGSLSMLTMTLDGVLFSSATFNLPARTVTKVITLTADEVPRKIKWLKGTPTFELKCDGTIAAPPLRPTFAYSTAIAGKNSVEITLEAFILYDTPASFYRSGIWLEVLRFLFDKTGINDDSDIEVSASKISHYCNGPQLGMEYDTKEGGSYYFIGTFYLMNYIKKKTINGRMLPPGGIKINCVDQGGAMRALCGILGLSVTTVQMAPFGYINKVNLVGVGPCNNPFTNIGHPAYSTEKLFTGGIDSTGKFKAAFGMHNFVRLGGTTSSPVALSDHKILDACALPILSGGGLDPALYNLSDYLTNSIDMALDSSEHEGITRLSSSADIYGYGGATESNLGKASDFTGNIFVGSSRHGFTNFSLTWETV